MGFFFKIRRIMKIIDTVKVRTTPVSELLALECVDRVELWHDGTTMVYLNAEYTEGRLTASDVDSLCKFENGKWQCFGPIAMDRTMANPRKEASEK